MAGVWPPDRLLVIDGPPQHAAWTRGRKRGGPPRSGADIPPGKRPEAPFGTLSGQALANPCCIDRGSAARLPRRAMLHVRRIL